jgi:pimeloyl-ACP methyl ester carboxylesterase
MALVTRLSQLGRRGGTALACAGLALGLLGASPGAAGPAPEDVVLLHGLGRSARVMRPLERELTRAGYRVHNLDYPSTRKSPELLVEDLHGQITGCCAWAPRVNFVTHSLGGVMTRAYLAEHPMPNLGRVVMLAPPNHGSEYVDVAGSWRVFQLLLGPTAVQLGTGATSLPNRLPDADFELGVIAGTHSMNPLGDAVIGAANDGTVSVVSTQLVGMRDFIELDVSHTFIMRNADAARQTIEFLQSGRFAR